MVINTSRILLRDSGSFLFIFFVIYLVVTKTYINTSSIADEIRDTEYVEEFSSDKLVHRPTAKGFVQIPTII